MANAEHKFIKLVSKKVDGENYYSIHYLDETDGEIHIGFSSSSLDVVSDFLKEFFIKNNDKQQKHAHWIKSEIPCEEYTCSNCGGACWYYDSSETVCKSKYCPNCGCKMDEVKE